MYTNFIKGVFLSTKNSTDFQIALVANGCHTMVIDKIYALCKQGEFHLASQLYESNQY